MSVVGFSDGGYSAYKLAAIHPELIERMVVMGAGDIPPKNKPGTGSLSADSLLKEHGDYFKKRVANMPEPNRWNESLIMINNLYNTGFLSEETFKKIKSPVLVMSGDVDKYFNPEAILAAHRFLPDSRLSIIPGCGHVILYCNFPAVWESMKGFLGFKD